MRWTGLARQLTWVLAAAGVAGTAEAEVVPLSGGPVPSVLWAQPVGIEDRVADEVDGIAVDPAGNVIVSGVMREGLSIGGQELAAIGAGDVFLASFAPSGGLNWARAFGGGNDDNAFDLQVDGEGNIVLSGWFAGTVDFGGITLSGAGSQDMFLAKFDPQGRTIWARAFGGPNGEGGNELAVTSGGEIAVAMLTDGGTVIDGRAFPGGGGERDSYVLRVDPNGRLLWVAEAAGPGVERIRAMSMNAAGEVFAGFQYRGSVTIGGQSIGTAGGWDGAIAKLNPGGSLAWLRHVGGGGTDNVRGAAAGPDGSVYVAGVFEGPVSLFGLDVPRVGRRGDDYLVRLSSAGEPLWVVTLAGPGPSNAGAEIRADSRGVLASGLLAREVTLRRNRDVVAELASPSGQPSSYLLGLTPEGAPRFAFLTAPQGGGAGSLGDVLAVSHDGRFAAQALRFRGTLQVDGWNMRSAGEKDSAVILLDLAGG